MGGRGAILVSSAGRRSQLIQLLRRAQTALGVPPRVVAIDIQRSAPAFLMADAAHIVPRVESAEFVPAVLDICAREGIALVVPTIDSELLAFSESRDQFESIGTTVAVSAPETVQIANDKVETARFFSERGLPAPRQDLAEAVLKQPDDFVFPLFVKPVRGSRSIGARLVHDPAELAWASRGGGYVVQSVARGVEYTVDALVNRAGRCVCVVPRKRLEVRDGEVSKGVTAKIPIVMDAVRRCCEDLPGAFGPMCVQVFYDAASEEMTFIEVNARFGGGYPLAWEAGARMPQWMLEEVLGVASTAKWDAWRANLAMIRYDEALFLEASDVGL